MPDPGREIRLRVGRAIRRLRLARGFSQERLAELAGSSYKHIGVIERGKSNVGLDALARIAGALSVDASSLFTPPSRRRAARGDRAAREGAARPAVPPDRRLGPRSIVASACLVVITSMNGNVI
jgi:transcriptional regulator with XRE-family HTH domain